MIQRKIILMFFASIVFTSCKKSYSHKEIDKLIYSEDAYDLIKGFYIIGEQKDTSYIEEVLKNTNDPRITHKGKFYSWSVYASKMMAMEKLSGIKPPKEITRDPDSTIIKFYTDWYHTNKNHFEKD